MAIVAEFDRACPRSFFNAVPAAILNFKVLWVKIIIWRKNSGAGGMKILHLGPGIGMRDAKTAMFRIAAVPASSLRYS